VFSILSFDGHDIFFITLLSFFFMLNLDLELAKNGSKRVGAPSINERITLAYK